jgi:hypothetical protein
MLARTTDPVLVRTALRRRRVVALLGPRRCGKATLAREFVSADSPNYFDLKDPASLARLAEPERIGVECKRAGAPTLTPSMRIALTDLKLDQLIVVYPVSVVTGWINVWRWCRWRNWWARRNRETIHQPKIAEGGTANFR